MQKMSDNEKWPGKFKPLRFGTSGLRDKVSAMTDMECYINTIGFLRFLEQIGELDGKTGKVALAGDRRESTGRIMAAVGKAIEDAGCEVLSCGRVPSPVLAYFAMERGLPGIMVTGSHIPEDRNGIKFTKTSGEVLKEDEALILQNVSRVRENVYAKGPGGSPFGKDGMFRLPSEGPAGIYEEQAAEAYVKRYVEVFGKEALRGRRVVLYEHSAVGRDIIRRILLELGAEVISTGRSERFVPVDTEKIDPATRQKVRRWAEEHEPLAVVSTDGDSDRPLFADEKGNILPGDKLGALVSLYLKPDFAAVPVSVNDAVISTLAENGIETEQTKIGSPYVIKAMEDKLALDAGINVVSWESNGGFLLGSDQVIRGEVLKALPTRDAALPIVAVMLLAIREGKPLSALFADSFPARFTSAGVVDDKLPGCGDYTAALGRDMICWLSPDDPDLKVVRFSDGTSVRTDSGFSEETEKKILKIKDLLEGLFSEDNELGSVKELNFTDGIKILFASGEFAHLRPSGNAPEFRMYATADTLNRAESIMELKNSVLPRLIELYTDMQKEVAA